MKITVNIECTPEEARAFMGLPDMQTLNAKIMEAMQTQFNAGMDPAALMKLWFPFAADTHRGNS